MTKVIFDKDNGTFHHWHVVHQSLWLDGTSRIWFEPVLSSSSVHGIKGNRVVYLALLSLDSSKRVV